MPIFVVARAIPMVRTNSPMRDFCWAKTCATQDRTWTVLKTSRFERLRDSLCGLAEGIDARRTGLL